MRHQRQLYLVIVQDDIDVDMESWHSNFEDVYDKETKAGNLIDLGKNTPDAPQGWWIPRYLVEGENAVAPDLKSVADLPRYAHLFEDPENPKMGGIYGGVAGWAQLEISEGIFNEYSLDDTFNFLIAGSSAALSASLVGAYSQEKGWCGYYWAPTAILGRLDMILLEGSEYPPAPVNILVSKALIKKAPDVVEMLKLYSTSLADNNEFLAQMEDNSWSAQETAEWFLKTKEEVWTKWISAEMAQKVREAL
jgi:glycine betaine/proline transport system substrate-binding protein